MTRRNARLWTAGLILGMTYWSATAVSADDRLWLDISGDAGPGRGRHIVLICGDEEYRSEEALPMLASVLARRHGFSCSVLFPIADDGTVDPNCRDNIPGLQKLASADLMVLATRFRTLPDDQMAWIDQYLQAGKPVLGLRTATHAFAFPRDSQYAYFSHDYEMPPFEGGFGRQVLGECWVSHHGAHGSESTRGIVVRQEKNHRILRGIGDGDIWGPTDVYTVRLPLPGEARPLLLGEVLAGMAPDSPPVQGPKNNPRLPIAWTTSYSWKEGPKGRVFVTTMGASQDFTSEGMRRLVINACYWCLGLQMRIPPVMDVTIDGEYTPSPFGFGGFQTGKRPADFLPHSPRE